MGKYLFFYIIDMWIMEICFRLTLKRRSPIGGLAYGMPLNMFTGRSSPVTLYVCLLPSTGPLVVCTCTFIILFRFQLYTIISILCNMQWIFNYFLLGNYNLVLGTILTLFQFNIRALVRFRYTSFSKNFFAKTRTNGF